MDIDRLITDRSRSVDASGIRRVFDLGAKLQNPINLSIGQPEFPVPEPIKRAAVEAIEGDRNGYTVTQGIPALRERIARHLAADLGWPIDANAGKDAPPDSPALLVTAGTSGALWLAFLALVGEGDEAIIPDPYFLLYPQLAKMTGGKAVLCNTYPDCRMTAERVEPLITPRTKLVLLNSPSNPAGVVNTQKEVDDLLDLCRRKNVLLISDEIYDEFTFSESRENGKFPSPCREPAGGAGGDRHGPRYRDTLLIRGFGKTYGVTGWRLGYVAGPRRLVEELTKLQQYTYVCAPSALQWGAVAALDVDMSAQVAAYQRRRDRVVERLSEFTEVPVPGGAFYAFPRVPERLGITAAQFVERAIAQNLLIIPGGVFSSRDTHFRLSFATRDETLERGLDVLATLLGG